MSIYIIIWDIVKVLKRLIASDIPLLHCTGDGVIRISPVLN